MEVIKIKYFAEDVPKLAKIVNGDWIDLYTAEDVGIKAGVMKNIRLGVGMILPKGYEAHVVPRSSTFKNYGIIQANSFGVVDNSYSGDDDEWRFLAYATRDVQIPKGTRICQFRIMKNQPAIGFTEVEHLNAESRGGFGSTGTS